MSRKVRGMLLAIVGLLAMGTAVVSLRTAAAGAANPPQATQVASSAQLVLKAAATSGQLTLWITRTRDHRPVSGAGNVSVRLDGHSLPVAAHRDDYTLDTGDLAGGTHAIEVIVAHDGIHELLAGSVVLPKVQTTLERLQQHAGWAWWVLNIAVVLLAFWLISRKKKPS